MALSEGKRKGGYEVIMLSPEGHVTEGSTSNVFWVRDGTLYTPSVAAGVLPGVTRAIVLGLAKRLGVSVARGLFPVEGLLEADEVFLTATIKQIVLVRRIDSEILREPVLSKGAAVASHTPGGIGMGQSMQGQVGQSCPGPLTRQLMNAYQGIVQRSSEGVSVDIELDALIRIGGAEEI